MSTVRIREVGADDWEIWRALRLDALRDAPGAFGSILADWADATEDAWRRRLQDVPFNVVAEVGGDAIGQASGTAPADGAGELISMWVDPSARRSGVARLLIDAVCEWAAASGASSVRLSVRRDNERAIRSYLSSGFVAAHQPADEPAELAMERRVRAT